MISKTLTYDAGGRTFAGDFVCPDAPGPRPGVLVLHGGGGLSDHERERCAWLAAAGYAAFAPDLFGEPFQSREHAMALIGALAGDADRLRGRLAAALDALRRDPAVDPAHTAAIGFCFGGMAALELARSGADLAVAISLHGGLTTTRPAEAGRVRARVLICAGAADPFVSREHRSALEDELTAAGADWRMLVFGGVKHGFTHRDAAPAPGIAYDAAADRTSWSATLEMLAAAFGG
jgi:dienelactone hydrolase